MTRIGDILDEIDLFLSEHQNVNILLTGESKNSFAIVEKIYRRHNAHVVPNLSFYFAIGDFSGLLSVLDRDPNSIKFFLFDQKTIWETDPSKELLKELKWVIILA